MLYSTVLFIHSWLRWPVLVLGVISLVNTLVEWNNPQPLAGRERTLQIAFTACLDLQFVLGLALYAGLSPFVPRTGEDFRTAMHIPQLRFFAVEHVSLMLLAVIVAHVANVFARKARSAPSRRKRWALGLIIAFALIAMAIPWPGHVSGRPLFRAFPTP